MKKKTVVKLSLVLCLLLCMSLVACNNDVKDEPHKAKSEWSSNGTEHWHDCATEGCTEKFEKADHAFGDWETKTPSGYGVPGEEKAVCSVCGYEETRPVDALEAKDNTVALKTDAAKSKTYDGKVIELSADDFTRNGDGAITFAYKVKGSEEAFSNEAPKNAGTYEVKVSVAATAEWKECETIVEYTIDKYELTEFYNTTYTKEYDGKVLMSGKCNSLSDVYLAIRMKSANVGTEIDEVKLIGNQKDNYKIDPSEIRAEITPKKVGGLSIETDVEDETGGETSIEKEIDGVNGEKITVVITFMQSWLSNECSLTLSTEGTAAGTCKIAFKSEDVKNYTFGDDIGTLFLIGS